MWTHAAVARSPQADISAATGGPSWLSQRFSAWRLCALRWDIRDGCSLSNPAAHPSNPAAMPTTVPATPLSPPGVLFQPHLFAGLRSSFFLLHCLIATARRPVGVPGISSPPSCRIMGALLGEPLRSLRLYQAPPPLAYSFAPPLWDEPLTSTLPGLIGTSYPPLRCLDSSTSPLVPTPRLHLRTVAGALAK